MKYEIAELNANSQVFAEVKAFVDDWIDYKIDRYQESYLIIKVELKQK